MVVYDVSNKDKIYPSYVCHACKLILRDPTQLSCGHRQCRTCIDGIEGNILRCTECNEETDKKDVMLDRGFRNDMKLLSIDCIFCNLNLHLKDYEEHLNKEHPNASCEFCEAKFVSSIKLDEHKQKECTKITVFCRLKDYGCFDPILRIELSKHYTTEIHQISIMNFLTSLQLQLVNYQNDRTSGMEMIERQSSVGEREIYSNDNMNPRMQNINETIDILKGLLTSLTTLKLNVEEQNAFINGIKPNQEILQQDVASLKQKVDDMQYVSYDGTLIWKITGFQKKMTDAQSERQTSIYSPPFYSSPTGYKMCTRLFLNGDGYARRTHMSLFFVLMRGPNDLLLKFPFNFKVTFCLHDQTPSKNHIIDSFRPDIQSNSFQRPRSEMNIASGIPNFVPLSIIQQENNPYVLDDTMFIKVTVDFANVPRTLPLSASSPNPSILVRNQQASIREETEWRVQRQSQRTTESLMTFSETIELSGSNNSEALAENLFSTSSPDTEDDNGQ